MGVGDPLVAEGRRIDQVDQPARRASGVLPVRQPLVQADDEVLDGLFLPALEHRQIGPFEDEVRLTNFSTWTSCQAWRSMET